MALYNKINQFTEDLAKKVHNLSSDVLMIALTTQAAHPVATNTVLANITQITYTNLSARTLSITSCVQTGGVLKLILADLVLTASGAVAPFGGICLYNSTPTGTPNQPLISWWEYGSDVTLANTETFTIDFDQAAGVLTIT